MSPKVPEAYLEARRMEILEAATKCFMEKGFHNTTMQDIYDAANLSPGAVYNYFSSKEEIVVDTVKEYTDWLISTFESVISENPGASIIEVVRFWLSRIKQDDIGQGISMQLEFYAEAARNNKIREAMLRSQDATHEKLVELIQHDQQTGIINAGLDPLSIARAIMGMLFGIMIHKSLDPEVDLDAYGEVCEAMFEGTFSSPPENGG